MSQFPEWIPSDVVEGYREKGVNELFDWQRDVIDRALAHGLTNLEGVPLQSKNVVYTAPTSAGKSLVAELLAITVLLTGRRVLFVLPYISVAREKYAHLQRILRRIDLNVAAFFGPQSAPPSGIWNAAVCTIEKANSLMNTYIHENDMHRLGLVVVDEVHMVADSSRGITLDSLIAKLIFSISRSGTGTRMVGMSATLTDAKRVAEWMNAELITATSRPVELDESIMVNGERRGVADERKRPQLSLEHRTYPEDSDYVAGLSISAFSSNQQVLVFCSSKAEVERTATLIAKTIDGLVKTGSPLRSLLDLRSLLRLKMVMEKRARHMDALLLKTLPRGVAFHHAGLTSEERECIESAFSSGALRILVATSTLSSGVNLPARMVIIRAQTRGPAALTGTSYRQMAGRAGRLGHNERERLAAHLPATEGTSSANELEATVRSPQFQQAADTFGHALQTGQLAPVFQQFGLPEETTSAAVSGDILEFAKKLTESEKNTKVQGKVGGQDNEEGEDGESSNQNTQQPSDEQVTPGSLKGPTPKRGKPSDDDQMDLD